MSETQAPGPDSVIRLVTDVDVARKALTRRHGFEETELSAGARERIRSIFGEDLSAEEVVDLIVAAVRSGGDRELRSLTERIDGGCPDELEVPRAEWSAAFDGLDGDLQDALEVAAKQIEAFHEKQKRTSWVDFSDEGALGQLVVPLDRIGVYARRQCGAPHRCS